MSAHEPGKASIDEDSAPIEGENTEEHTLSGVRLKSGAQVAHKIRRSAGKNDARYWLPRLFRKINARGETSPHYSMRVQFRGRRMAFALGTGNKDAAARLAAGLYGELLAKGLDAVLAKYRAQKPEKPQELTTVGQWIAAARQVFDGRPATFGGYARALRFIASEILAVAKHKKRFGRTQAKSYRQEIDGAPLGILTPDAIQAWRIRYVQRAGDNPARQRAARITCNSTIRQAKALFSRKILKFAGGVALPDPLPFAGVELYPRESMRYQSKLNPAVLLQAASRRAFRS